MATEDKLDGIEKKEGPLGDFSGSDAEDKNEIEVSNDLPHRNNDRKELDDRNEQYTQILAEYRCYIGQNLEQILDAKMKMLNTFKFLMYGIIIGSFVVIILAIVVGSANISSIVAIIGALVSLISSIIIIPTKMTEYLFNVNETMQFGDIIKNIQEYDKAIRDDLYKYK